MTDPRKDKTGPPAPAEAPSEESHPPETPPDDVPAPAQADEAGGPRGPEPTRFGDWERKGRCIDF